MDFYSAHSDRWKYSQRLQGGTADDGGIVARELVFGEQLADFHLDEVKQSGSSTWSTLFI
jgi:hypothetical protein